MNWKACSFSSQTVYVANDDSRQLKLQMLKGEIQADPPQGAGQG